MCFQSTITKDKLQQMLSQSSQTQFQVQYFDDMIIIRVSPMPEQALLHRFDRNHTVLAEEDTTSDFGIPVATSDLNNAQCYHLDKTCDRLTLFLALRDDCFVITSSGKTAYLDELQQLLSVGQRLNGVQPHFLLRLWQSIYGALVGLIGYWCEKPLRIPPQVQENYLTI